MEQSKNRINAFKATFDATDAMNTLIVIYGFDKLKSLFFSCNYCALSHEIVIGL